MHEITHEMTHEISPALEEGGHGADSPRTPPSLLQGACSEPELAGGGEGDGNLDAALDGGEGTAMTPLQHCAPPPPAPPSFALDGGVGVGVGVVGGGGVGGGGGSGGGGGGSAAARPEAAARAGAGEAVESESEVEARLEAETGREASAAVRAELHEATTPRSISRSISGGGESDEAQGDLSPRWRERISEAESDDALAPPAMEAADEGERGAEDGEQARDYSCDDGFGELWEDRVARLRAASPIGANGAWRLAAFISKVHPRAAEEPELQPSPQPQPQPQPPTPNSQPPTPKPQTPNPNPN